MPEILEENIIDSVLLLYHPSESQWGGMVEAMKPGAHLLLINPIKEHHLHTIKVEDEGLEIRDTIAYVFADSESDAGMMLVTVARKPLQGTVAENVLRWETGGLNIDNCRIEHVTVDGGNLALNPHLRSHINGGNGGHIISTETERRVVKPHSEGRWPSNITHDNSPVVLTLFPNSKGQQGAVTGEEPSSKTNSCYGEYSGRAPALPRGDSGSAARFFYVAPCLNDLYSYLIRLITPPEGTILTNCDLQGLPNDYNYVKNY